MKPQLPQPLPPRQRITEQINPLSTDLDIVGPVGIVRILRQCDAQIFSGWSHFPGLIDEEIIFVLESITSRERIWFHPRNELMKEKIKVIVALAGAGTSGRLAFHCARTMNVIAQKKSPHVKFHYLIAGGDLALIKVSIFTVQRNIQSSSCIEILTEIYVI
jgi:N-acetylmuramic acid 6-phosphate (MurNAc-6-P) etherase